MSIFPEHTQVLLLLHPAFPIFDSPPLTWLLSTGGGKEAATISFFPPSSQTARKDVIFAGVESQTLSSSTDPFRPHSKRGHLPSCLNPTSVSRASVLEMGKSSHYCASAGARGDYNHVLPLHYDPFPISKIQMLIPFECSPNFRPFPFLFAGGSATSTTTTTSTSPRSSPS